MGQAKAIDCGLGITIAASSIGRIRTPLHHTVGIARPRKDIASIRAPILPLVNISSLSSYKWIDVLHRAKTRITHTLYRKYIIDQRKHKSDGHRDGNNHRCHDKKYSLAVIGRHKTTTVALKQHNHLPNLSA